ncbi:hypothetical protein MMC14_006628 [Varicellaria rhodocarpa]|nr:hypothetical protein [Varicellaria rhodocarpa]
MKDDLRWLRGQPWIRLPYASPLVVRISLSNPPVRSGRMTIYEPTGYQSPFVQSELSLQPRISNGSHLYGRRRCTLMYYGHWEPRGDPARLTKSTKSEATFNLARRWIHKCLMEHQICSFDSDLPFDPPTRVTDVGTADGSQNPRLYVTGEQDQNMRYMTLSHC